MPDAPDLAAPAALAATADATDATDTADATDNTDAWPQDAAGAADTQLLTDGTPRPAVLCRYGEIFLKGANRGFFENKLLLNMRRAVGSVGRGGAKVQRLHGRFLVWPRIKPAPGPAEDPERSAALTVAALQKVFGLTSISPALVVAKDFKHIEVAARQAFVAALQHGRPRSFKVESRRADKRFQPSSPVMSQQIGGALHTEFGIPVDVHHPELHVGIEVGYEYAFVYAQNLPGLGGLPVGCTGKVDLLLSGGIDSPVAGWMAMKRGCDIAATYFHSFPYTGDKTRDKVRRMGRKLAGWQGPLELRVVPFTEAQKALRAAGPSELAVVLYRRMMMRVASLLARRREALALVTGEALGQVASQTLENMAVIGAAASLPILRPLVTHDKHETVAWARKIDTYELSIEPYEDCCSLWVPQHPATKAKLSLVEKVESGVDIEALVKGCLDGVETIVCEP